MSRRDSNDLPSKKVHPPHRLVVMNPNKGLNNLVSPSLIDNKEWADLMNVEYDEGGVVRKRSGYTAIGNGLTAARGLGNYRTETINHLVTIDSGTLKYFIGSGAWNSATGATFTVGQDTTFTQARQKFFIWNGTDGGAYWDGTTVTRPGTMPKAAFSVYYNSYHIAAGVPGQASRLYVSNVSDATDFTVTTGGTQPQPDSTNDAENGNPNVPGATVFAGTPAVAEARVFDVQKNDGDKITGLAVFQNVLLIFKEKAIYQMTFDSTGLGSIVPITSGTGAIGHRSITCVENDVYFMSRQGLRILGNQPGYISNSGSTIRTRVVSIKITPTINSIVPQYYNRMNSIYFGYKYILAVPTSTSTIDREIVYDTRFDAFTIWKGFDAQAMCRYVDSVNKEYLYFLHDNGTQVYVQSPGTYNDNGNAIEAWVTSKAQNVDNPDLTKFWIDIRMIFRQLTGQITFTVYQDGGVTVGTAVIGGGGSRGMGLVYFGANAVFGSDGKSSASTGATFADTPESIGLNLDSRTIQFKIYNNRVNENFVLLGEIYAFYPKSHFVFDSSAKIYI